MAQLLALEWDDQQARVVVAAARVGHVEVEHAFTVELTPGASAEAASSSAVGEKIHAALAARHVTRPTTLVSVGRPNIELKRLSLPPAPKGELPELVRFQAMREFNALDEDWPLDFVPLAGGEDEPHDVLAATISPELVAQIQSTCERAELRPQTLSLRPFAAASLFCRRRRDDTERIVLLVDLLAGEADLTVIEEDRVVFPRTVRLPGQAESEVQAKALVAETRRTIAAAQNQLGGERIEAIYFCGGEENLPRWKEFEAELDLPTRGFNPLEGLSLSAELQRTPPQHPGRFAPLVGMLLDEAQRRPHALDFLNPRRQARASRIDRRLVLAAATAAAVLLSGGLWIYLQLSWMTDDIAMNRNKHGSPAAKKELERAGKAVKDAAAIGEWAERDAVWLDELRELSVEFPPAEKAMLSEDDALSFSSHARGAALRFKALLDGQQTGRQIGDKLRDEGHVFAIDRQGERKDGKHYGLYGWELDGSILVLSPEEQTSRKQQAPRPAATPAGGTTP